MTDLDPFIDDAGMELDRIIDELKADLKSATASYRRAMVVVEAAKLQVQGYAREHGPSEGCAQCDLMWALDALEDHKPGGLAPMTEDRETNHVGPDSPDTLASNLTGHYRANEIVCSSCVSMAKRLANDEHPEKCRYRDEVVVLTVKVQQLREALAYVRAGLENAWCGEN